MQRTSTPYGEITVRPLAQPFQEPTQTLEAVYVWSPRFGLLREMPITVRFEMQCWRRIDGVRYFTHGPGYGPMVMNGFAAGLAIVDRQLGFGAHERQSYRLMFLIFRLVRSMREHLRRKFTYSRDLFLRISTRTAIDDVSILPEGAKFGTDYKSSRAVIREFVKHGEEAARQAGVPKPTKDQMIQYGLFQAAESQPLELALNAVPALVRSALFAEQHGNPDPIDEELRGWLEERLCVALNQHLDDDQATFERWFLGAESSFFKQVAKQTTAPGGAVSVSLVRRVLLDLGWESYGYVAQCFHALAEDFTAALPEPLTAAERVLFERIYYSQPTYGNLPLLLLIERLPDIQPALMPYLNGQDDERMVPILHRLLDYYREMATTRRAADQRGQQRSRHRRKFGSALDVPYHDGIENPRKSNSGRTEDKDQLER